MQGWRAPGWVPEGGAFPCSPPVLHGPSVLGPRWSVGGAERHGIIPGAQVSSVAVDRQTNPRNDSRRPVLRKKRVARRDRTT